MKINSKSRIMHKDGLYFYEQDILMLSMVYGEDTEMTMTLDYQMSGVGLVYQSTETGHEYLIRIGADQVQMLHKSLFHHNEIVFSSVNIRPPMQSLSVVFEKRGRNLLFKSKEGDILAQGILPENMDEYRIGLYSNRGNIIKSMHIKTDVPQGWRLNIKNTRTGRVGFLRDKLFMENCDQKVELEALKTSLGPGEYYLDFEKEGDIEAFVFDSEDQRFDPEKKSIIEEGGKILIDEPKKVSLLFRGKNGSASNVILKKNPNDPYVSTRGAAIDFSGSHIRIDTTRITNVELTAVIYDLPVDTIKYGVLYTGSLYHLPEGLGINTGEQFDLSLNTVTKIFEIIREDGSHGSFSYTSTEDFVYLMKNMNASIGRLTVIFEDGNEVDVINQETTRYYVPDVVKSPILVLDEHENPLDLSSSYRWQEDEDGCAIFMFTNKEREVFQPQPLIQLNKRVKFDSLDYVQVYGIREEAKISPDNILKMNTRGVDTIEEYADSYDLISPAYLVNGLNTKLINISVDLRGYKEIVVDYLKEDSYCINHQKDLDSYEVDIATSRQEVTVVYDYISEEEQMLSEYILTEIDPNTAKYIVLRK